MELDTRTCEYVKTIVDAAAKGTVSVEGMKIIGWIMRGWTLDAAKHQVLVSEPRLVATGGKVKR